MENDDHGFGWLVEGRGRIVSDCGGWRVWKVRGGFGFYELVGDHLWNIVATADTPEGLNCGIYPELARLAGW